MMKIGKPFWALMHPTENYIVWDYEEPFAANTKKDLLEQLELVKDIRHEDLLEEYVIRKVVLSYVEKSK